MSCVSYILIFLINIFTYLLILRQLPLQSASFSLALCHHSTQFLNCKSEKWAFLRICLPKGWVSEKFNLCSSVLRKLDFFAMMLVRKQKSRGKMKRRLHTGNTLAIRTLAIRDFLIFRAFCLAKLVVRLGDSTSTRNNCHHESAILKTPHKYVTGGRGVRHSIF